MMWDDDDFDDDDGDEDDQDQNNDEDDLQDYIAEILYADDEPIQAETGNERSDAAGEGEVPPNAKCQFRCWSHRRF